MKEILRVAVCDDEKTCIEKITDAIQQICAESGIYCNIVSFNDGEAILNDLKSNKYDLILLDICMPNVSGFRVAETVYKITGGDNLVFVSNDETLVYETFEFRPFGFAKKRSLWDDLVKVVSKWKKIYGDDIGKHITVTKNDEDMLLRIEDIVRIRSYGHYVYIYTEGAEYTERGKLSTYECLTNGRFFVKCNRSEMCNLKYVCKADSKKVYLVDGEYITIGREYKNSVKSKYDDYIEYVYM